VAGHNTVRVLDAGVGSLLAFCDVLTKGCQYTWLGPLKACPAHQCGIFSVTCWAGPEICCLSRPYLKAKLGILTTACTPYYTAYDYRTAWLAHAVFMVGVCSLHVCSVRTCVTVTVTVAATVC
jgi:hypothetical protein